MTMIDVKNETGIVNYALSQLKIDPIPDIRTEKSKISNEMLRNFQLSKESVLRSYVFDWAHKAEKLVKYTGIEGGYVKPSDYINFIGLGTCESFCCCSSDWANLETYSHKASVRVVNKRMFISSCCLEQYEYLHYTHDNLHYSDIPAELFEAIGLKLASMCCMNLTGDLNLQKFLIGEFESILSKARKFSGFENKTLGRQNRICKYPLSPKSGGFF